jgi:cytochrome c
MPAAAGARQRRCAGRTLMRISHPHRRRAHSAIHARDDGVVQQTGRRAMLSSNKKGRLSGAAAVFGVLAVFCTASAAQALDAEAAKALVKDNECTKCHAVDKEKKGPSYRKIAAKYKGKPDGEDKAIKSMTTGPKVKLEDGTQEDHKIIDTKDAAAIRNVARWILSH